MNLDLRAICRYWTEREGWARCPTYGYGVGFHFIHTMKGVLKSVASVVFDRNSLLPFNPTYMPRLVANRGKMPLPQRVFMSPPRLIKPLHYNRLSQRKGIKIYPIFFAGKTSAKRTTFSLRNWTDFAMIPETKTES